MEEEFRALLMTDPSISALVGTRVNWGAHPQGAPLPAIVLNVASGFEDIHMNGTGPHEGRVQVDCYGLTSESAKKVGRAVISALNAYRGGGFLFIQHTSARDTREGGTNQADRPYRTGLDFNIKWRAT